MLRAYASGKVLVLRGHRFQAGRQVLCRTTLPATPGRTRIVLAAADGDPRDASPRAADLIPEGWRFLCQAALGDDLAASVALRDAVRAANGELDDLVAALFPCCRFARRCFVYDLAEAFGPGPCYDGADTGSKPQVQLRAFVNLDDLPRLWYVGVPATGASGASGASAARRRHSVLFKPGEVWFANTAITPHEVIYGRRLLEGVFFLRDDAAATS